MLEQFIAWLAATKASALIQQVFWIIPSVQTVHILAISVVFSSMAMLDLRLLGIGSKGQSVQAMVQRILPWLWGALAVLALSGTILIIGEPHRALGNTCFLVKMCMLAAAVAVTLRLRRLAWRDAAIGQPNLSPAHRPVARFLAVLSLTLWVGIIVAGRLIAYTA